jgi:hypothetical protein
MFPLKKTYTLAGFEPGSSVPEADAMSAALRRQGLHICVFYYVINSWAPLVMRPVLRSYLVQFLGREMDDRHCACQ